MSAREEGAARLKLALSVGFGLIPRTDLSRAQLELLQVDEADFLDANKIVQECVEIVLAWHLESAPAEQPDMGKVYREVALGMIAEIEAHRGLLPHKHMMMPQEFVKMGMLDQLMRDRIIVRSMNGYKLGPNAEKAKMSFPGMDGSAILDVSEAGRKEQNHEEGQEGRQDGWQED